MLSNGVHAGPLTAKSFIYLLVAVIIPMVDVLGPFWTDHVLSAMSNLRKREHRLPLQRGGDFRCVFSRPFCLARYFDYEIKSSS